MSQLRGGWWTDGHGWNWVIIWSLVRNGCKGMMRDSKVGLLDCLPKKRESSSLSLTRFRE